MNSGVKVKLFVMMFLQFFIWGAWLPLIFAYLPKLGFSPMQITLILWAFNVSAIVAMFFSNQFADRNFSGERFLAFSHLVGGLAILGLAFTKSFYPFFALMAVHCFFYVPTISITNSIAFAAMKDAKKEFGIIRMGGTVGWIAVAWPLFFLMKYFGNSSEDAGDPLTTWQPEQWTFVIAGVSSLVLAAFSLTLPHTPPKTAAESGGESLAWLAAIEALKKPFILILFLVTFVDATVHQLYFNWTGAFLETQIKMDVEWITPIMSIGQIAEIFTMAVLGYCLAQLGWRKTMIIGILGHAARFAVFAFFPSQDYAALIISVNVLHGICYAFFFATVYIFVDEFLPKDVRSSAQGLFNLMILGVGPMVANLMGPYLMSEVFVSGEGDAAVVDFRGLFLVPCGMALVASVLLATCFWPPKKAEDEDGKPATEEG